MNRPEPPASKEFAIESLMRDPTTTKLACLIPDSDQGGRPRHYPNWVYIVCNELVSQCQTAGKVQSEMGDPRAWAMVRQLAQELFPVDQQPPERPIQWYHFKYVKNTYLAREDILREYRRIQREAACALAKEAGNSLSAAPASPSDRT